MNICSVFVSTSCAFFFLIYFPSKAAETPVFFRYCSALDPSLRGTTPCIRYLKRLYNTSPAAVKQQIDSDNLKKEIHLYNIDQSLEYDYKNIRVDKWWSKRAEGYPNLSKLALSLLTIFAGPVVEGYFSQMGNILSESRNRLNIETYNAAHQVSLQLQALIEVNLQNLLI